mgnify:CR=1 FL=1
MHVDVIDHTQLNVAAVSLQNSSGLLKAVSGWKQSGRGKLDVNEQSKMWVHHRRGTCCLDDVRAFAGW